MTLVDDKPRGAIEDSQTGQVRGFGQLGRELGDLTPGLIAYNLAYLVLVWAVALAAIAVFWAFPAWYTFLLAFLVVSSRQQALLNCEHEAVHRKFLPGRRADDIVGRFLCAAPVGSPFGAARARHLAHHRLLSTPEDPDRHLHNGEPPKNTPWGLMRYFLNGLLGGYAVMVLLGPKDGGAPPVGAARSDLASLVLVQGALAVALTLTTAWWVYPALWLTPLLTVTAFCHLTRSFAEHAITREESVAHANRLITIKSNMLERALLSPYWMNLHAEHHIVPSVPAARLKKVHERLATRDDLPPLLIRSSYASAVKRYVQSLKR